MQKKKTKNKNNSKRKLTTKQKHLESQLESNLDLIRDYSICKCYVYLTYEQHGRQTQNREQNKTQQRQAKNKVEMKRNGSVKRCEMAQLTIKLCSRQLCVRDRAEQR